MLTLTFSHGTVSIFCFKTEIIGHKITHFVCVCVCVVNGYDVHLHM